MSHKQPSTWFPAFTGRTEELEWLHECWNRAIQGKPQIAVLRGGPGRGKTRIVREFYEQISAAQGANRYWPAKLNTDSELQLAPRVDELDATANTPLPWLWWATRFEEPGGRDRQDMTAIFRSVRWLKLHLGVAIKRKQARDSYWQIALEAGKTIASTLPTVGSLISIYELIRLTDSAVDVSQNLGDESTRLQRERAYEDGENLIESIMELIDIALDTSESSQSTIPMIVVLDDAHWIDSFSLAVIQRLLDRHANRAAPLLIIATYWQQEWEDHLPDDFSNCRMPENFRMLTSLLHNDSNVELLDREIKPFRIGDGLRTFDESIRETLPGLTAPQRKQLIENHSQNLKLLVESIRLLLDNAYDLFQHDDSSQPLSKFGEQMISELARETEVYRLVKRRFRGLGPTARALGAASAQGLDFFPDLVTEMSEALVPDSGAAHESIDEASRKVHRTAEFVVFEQPLSRFAESLYFRIASEYLAENGELVGQVKKALRVVICKWMAEQRWRQFEHRNAQVTFLNLATKHLSTENGVNGESDDETELLWLEAAVQLIRLTTESATPMESFELVKRVSEMAEPTQLAELARRDEETFQSFDILMPWLVSVQSGDKALAALERVITHERLSLEQAPVTLVSMRKLSASLERIGDVKYQIGMVDGIAEAESHYSEALDLRRQIISQFGDSPDFVDELRVALTRAGLVKLDMTGEHDASHAKQFFTQALEHSRHVIAREGETEERLVELIGSMNHLGTAERAIGKDDSLERGAAIFREALGLADDTEKRFELSLGVQYEKAQAYFGLASIALDWQLEPAMSEAVHFARESLRLRRQIADDFGQTPRRLSFLAKAYGFLAQVQMIVSPATWRQEAIEHLEESCQIAEQLVEKFGETARHLEQFVASIEHLADVKQTDPRVEVEPLIEKATTIRRRLKNKFGTTPEQVREYAGTSRRIGLDQAYRSRYETTDD